MAPVQWERYLFDKHNLVALGPLENGIENGIQLFNVLVKQRKEGKKTVLVKAGTLIGLRSQPGTEDWEAVVAKIEGFLDGSLTLRKKGVLAGIVERHMDGDYKCNIHQRSNVIIAFLKLLIVGGGRSEALKLELKNVQTERIDSRLIDNLFTGNPPFWVPDLGKIALEKQVSSGNGLIEIWVVTEIKYCTTLTIAPEVGSLVNAELHLPNQLTSIPVDVGCGIKGSRKSAETVVASGFRDPLGRVPFGFKALKLVYDESGNLQKKISGGEEARPIYRDDKSLDPNECPSYHMGSLFVNDNEDLMECLTLCD